MPNEITQNNCGIICSEAGVMSWTVVPLIGFASAFTRTFWSCRARPYTTARERYYIYIRLYLSAPSPANQCQNHAGDKTPAHKEVQQRANWWHATNRFFIFVLPFGRIWKWRHGVGCGSESLVLGDRTEASRVCAPAIDSLIKVPVFTLISLRTDHRSDWHVFSLFLQQR